ncbi:hypothetical protein ACVIGB_001117 [Bradyrhizobium sp. USDA 4341]
MTCSSTDDMRCGDPLRRLFFERVGRYFENEGQATRGDGACEICGELLTDAVISSKRAVCRPQRSIGQERVRPAEGQPLKVGVPLKMIRDEKSKREKPSAKNKLSTLGGIALIAPDRTFVAANVIPVLELPIDMTAVPVEQGIYRRFLREFVANPPPTPFLLIMWTRKNTIPLAMTESLSRTIICGDDVPQIFDMSEVEEMMVIANHLGFQNFSDACWLRNRIQRETDPKKIEKNNNDLGCLLGKGLAMRDFNRLPSPTSTVFDIVAMVCGPNVQLEAKSEAA